MHLTVSSYPITKRKDFKTWTVTIMSTKNNKQPANGFNRSWNIWIWFNEWSRHLRNKQTKQQKLRTKKKIFFFFGEWSPSKTINNLEGNSTTISFLRPNKTPNQTVYTIIRKGMSLLQFGFYLTGRKMKKKSEKAEKFCGQNVFLVCRMIRSNELM